MQPGNPSRNVFARWRLEGEVSSAELEEAWQLIVARHPTLRTSIVPIDGAPVQAVEPAVPFHLRESDLRLLSEADAAAEAERIAAVEAHTPFDLAIAPLIRVTHVRLRERVSIVMMTAHHAVCDGWSVGILAREMGEICAAQHAMRAPSLAELPLSYGEYSVWQRQWLSAAALTKERAFLANLLRGYRQFELPPDRPRPAVQAWDGDIVSILLDKDLTAGLESLARENACTLFMTTYAALLVLLHRSTGETDIALSTQVAGRDDVQLESLVGTFVNTIALRTDLSGDPTFADLLERARDTVTDAFEVRHVPTEMLVEIVKPKRDLSRNPLFSVNFVFQRSFVANATYGGFRLIDLPSRSAGAMYDLCFFMVERPEGWRASCEYNRGLFETRTVTELLERFNTLLRAVAADPHRPISELPILIESDRREPFEANRSEVGVFEPPGVPPMLDAPSGNLVAPLTPTETTLKALVAELLEHDRFALEDDLFAAGLHSMLALRLVARIKQSFGIELPLRAFFDNPTCSALARRIDLLLEAQGASEPQPIATLNAEGPRTPFIYLHSDLFAGGLYCRRLAASLGPSQPIHMIAPHGTAGLGLPPTIEEMAQDYLERIRAVQPDGPYRLGGFCVSGLVAYELARLLLAEGHAVERVVLVNTSALPTRSVPGFDRVLRTIGLSTSLQPKLREKLCYLLARLHMMVATGPVTAIRHLWERLSTLPGRRDAAGEHIAEPPPSEKRSGTPDTEKSFAHLVAALTYHPKPYAGDVTLVWGIDQRTKADAPSRRWKSLAHNLELLEICGGHVQPLNANLKDLARALDYALRD